MVKNTYLNQKNQLFVIWGNQITPWSGPGTCCWHCFCCMHTPNHFDSWFYQPSMIKKWFWHKNQPLIMRRRQFSPWSGSGCCCWYCSWCWVTFKSSNEIIWCFYLYMMLYIPKILIFSLVFNEKMTRLRTVNFDPKKAIFSDFEPPGLSGYALVR